MAAIRVRIVLITDWLELLTNALIDSWVQIQVIIWTNAGLF